MSAAMSAAFSASSAASAAAAQAAAHEAKVTKCKALLPIYNAQTATVSEMREYAGCVEAVYPSEVGPDAVIAMKVFFVVALAGAIYGAWSHRDEEIIDVVLFGGVGFIMAPFYLGVMVMIFLGIGWLFT